MHTPKIFTEIILYVHNGSQDGFFVKFYIYFAWDEHNDCWATQRAQKFVPFSVQLTTAALAGYSLTFKSLYDFLFGK